MLCSLLARHAALRIEVFAPVIVVVLLLLVLLAHWISHFL